MTATNLFFLPLFAALDPASPIPALCGITWTLLMPTSVVAALVAGALCAFRRTRKQALRLSKLGLWSGAIACGAATLGIVVTYGYEKYGPESLTDGLLMILFTGIAPAVAFFIRRFCLNRSDPPAAPAIQLPSVEPQNDPQSTSS